MKPLLVATSLISISLLGACSTTDVMPASPGAVTTVPAMVHTVAATTRETMLLVSLDDGTVIMQTINSGADVCFKRNSDSSTTCLTQGEPVIDPATNKVIGFEMIEAHIDLVASSD